MNSESLYFLEQTDFALRFARCDPRDLPLRINRVEEVSTINPAAVVEAARRVFPVTTTPLICALRPAGLRIEVGDANATAPSLEAAYRVAGGELPPAVAAMAVDTVNGGPNKTARWLTVSAPTTAFEAAREAVSGFDCKPTRCTSATTATAGALVASVSGPTVMLEIGARASHAILVTPAGILRTCPIGLTRDTILSSVQAELGLKSTEAAAQTFFNTDLNLADVGARIADRLADTVDADLARLVSDQPKPFSLYCGTLPVPQQWLIAAIARIFGLEVHVPDLPAWRAKANVTFGSSVVESKISPAWFGLLHAIHAQATATSAPVMWLPSWRTLALGNAIVDPIGRTPTAAPAPTPPAPAAPATPSVAAAPSRKATPPPTPAPTPAPRPAEKKPAPAPAEPARAATSVAYGSEPRPPARAGKSQSKALLIGIAAAVIVVAGGFILYSQQAQATRAATAKQQAEAQLKAEQARAREAEERAKREALARQKIELDAAQKLAQAESARAAAEKEAQVQAAARRANARGALVVTTEPAGAMVAVGDLPPRPSPATFADLKTGSHRIVVTSPTHETATTEGAVKENETTSVNVPLQRSTGTLEIASTPAGMNYELRPAAMLMVDPKQVRTGTTPAALPDVAPGDYTVTFSSPGWSAHTERVSVTRNENSRTSWVVSTGRVTINSQPQGATVKRKGVPVGTTPLTLTDVAPGAAEFEIAHANFDQPAAVSGVVEAGRTLALQAQFAASSRVFAAGEVDRQPEALNDKPIKVPYYLTLNKPQIELEFVVGRDGVARSFSVRSATEKDLARYSIPTVTGWKFRPALKDGKPVSARMLLTLRKFVVGE
ncbi:PEGA domain-containing protein [Opitutus sp. ER46]|uniref:PEGA domain-containing protein n=1 Tax=Opitutus sp. ER46 TaxID=2161864 RepID=UPI000D3061A9|nr:PEGA domain-containing protein [Opitutus sp. ER46]PTX91370.1 hypothetical protein DB354_15855 [Opitutus sp. ER46]